MHIMLGGPLSCVIRRCPFLPARGPAAILAPDEFANEDSCFESLPIGRRTLVTLLITATTAAWCAVAGAVAAAVCRCGLWVVVVSFVVLSCWGAAVSSQQSASPLRQRVR